MDRPAPARPDSEDALGLSYSATTTTGDGNIVGDGNTVDNVVDSGNVDGSGNTTIGDITVDSSDNSDNSDNSSWEDESWTDNSIDDVENSNVNSPFGDANELDVSF